MKRPYFRNFNREFVIILGQKKIKLVSGAPGEETKSHAGGRKNIFFWKMYRDRYQKSS